MFLNFSFFNKIQNIKIIHIVIKYLQICKIKTPFVNKYLQLYDAAYGIGFLNYQLC